MVAVPVLSVEFVDEVRSAVDDEMLIGEVTGRVDAAEQLDAAQAVEAAVGVVNRAQDLLHAVFSGGIAILDDEVFAEDPLEVTDMTGSDELIAAADAEVQISGGEGRQINFERLGFFLWCHAVSCSGGWGKFPVRNAGRWNGREERLLNLENVLPRYTAPE